MNSHLGLADQASDAAKRPIEENVKKEDKEGNLFTNKEPKRESVKEPVTEAEPRPDKEDPPEEKEPETSTEEPPEEKAPETPPEEPTPPEEDEGEAESATDESEDAALEQTQPESSQDQGGNGDPNVKQVITDNWPVVPTEQENHTHITFEKGSLDWKEMTTAIAAGAGLSEDDMIVWWAAGEGTDKAIATVTNQAQTENYRVQVTWVDDAGYKPVKTEILYENDQKN
ncbi:YrrS family protein [Thalassobacillus sp. B23F22_16]|uniref:YrrS family protein n=1 Tax=Thalassobacillus sp. B23F22_16 TaxID=3459513 RepID=UPI00373F13DD